LGWELVLAPLILIGYPAVAGGLGWRAAFEFVPDLSLTVLAVAGLAVLTGLARTVRIVQGRTTRGPETDDPPVTVPSAVTVEHDPTTAGTGDFVTEGRQHA
jgi:hypothetical protein